MSKLDPERFNRLMARQQARIADSMKAATDERGLIVLLTGDGKGKSTSAFGNILRSLAYGKKVGLVQFIKGVQLSGEEVLIRKRFPEVDFVQMATGFTWDTQNHAADSAAARNTWKEALRMLQSDEFDLVVLDELTYMLAFDFLDEAEVIEALLERPAAQHVIITGRGGGSRLRAIADTVSEVKNIRHAYEAGVMAQQGLDY